MSEIAKPGQGLRRWTSARVSLAAAGAAIATRDQLEFQLDHALARDAVHAAMDTAGIVEAIQSRGCQAIALRSAVASRQQYLRRPDLGRRLDAASAAKLASQPSDVAFVIADGLSALAVDRHAIPLLDALLPVLDREQWSIGPFCVVEQARVAIGDEIGQRLNANMTVMLIGERPGLSAADSLGVYLTWLPQVGRTDAERNCVSNVRHGGLGYAEAAERTAYYMQAARQHFATGTLLKEGSFRLALPTG